MKEEKIFPEEIEEVFINLQKEVEYLHRLWKMFEFLYIKSETTVALLNEGAPSYFLISRISLYRDVINSISRILDKAEFSKFKNLSLDLIIKLLDKNSYPELVPKLKEIKNKLDVKKENLIIFRHKYIAHKDLDHVLNKEEGSIKVNISDVEELLELIREFMNECEYYFLDKSSRYEIYESTGVRKLITQLKKARAYDELEKTGLIERGYWIKNLRKKEFENKK